MFKSANFLIVMIKIIDEHKIHFYNSNSLKFSIALPVMTSSCRCLRSVSFSFLNETNDMFTYPYESLPMRWIRNFFDRWICFAISSSHVAINRFWKGTWWITPKNQHHCKCSPSHIVLVALQLLCVMCQDIRSSFSNLLKNARTFKKNISQ